MIIFKVRFVILMALFFAACSGDQSDSKTRSAAEEDTAASAGFSDSLVIKLAGADSVTVLDLLLDAHEVDYRATLSGVFVTAIDAVESGDNYFWIYTVNDSSVSRASDECFTSDGDRVKWHFRKF